MNMWQNKFNVLVLSCLFGSATAMAAIDVAQAPLETGTSVDPNIIFMIDDSGSMRWGFMPDDLDDNFNLGSNGSNCSSSTSYGGTNVRPCNASGRKYLTSSYLNKLYYDPTVVYEIPKKGDGVTAFPTPSFTSAPVNGYVTGSTTINLSNNYRAIIADYNYPSSSTGFTVSSSTSSSSAGAAFYHTFSGTSSCIASPRQDSCYTLVTVPSAQQANFAIWFSYYRTRIMAAKAGVTKAFHGTSSKMRVGYDGINVASGAQTIANGVQPFSGSNKLAFFSWLHALSPNGNTPLRSALQASGKYLQTKNPWRSNPNDSTSALLECRQNYTILMTDGYYNNSESLSGVGNQDGSNSATITGPKNRTYTYTAKDPYKDSNSDSLADVAMKYWKNDLDEGWPSGERLDNTVPTSNLDPAFWQHMVTFGVGFGVEGSISDATANAAVTSGSAVSWWGGTEEQNKINDLMHASVNSRGSFFSASNPGTFAEKLAGTLNAIAERVGSASNIAATAINSLQTESNLYQARYISGEWSGDLWSYAADDVTTPVWKASDVMPAASARTILFGSDANVAKEFQWVNLSSNEKKALGNSNDVLDYVRGVTTKEKRNGGTLRNRTKILGDLVNSSPELVAEPYDLSYHRYSWDGANTYRTFLSGSAATRTKTIYVGGNDGMLHGFNADTGVETFAYIPRAVMTPISGDTVNVLKKYSESTYSHVYSVDGSPAVTDVYLNGAWRSILIGSMGRGGNGLFAIDVTNPSAMTTSSVLWDKTFDELGVYLGKPQVTRAENGDWVLMVGYGYNNSTNKSGLLVIKLSDGSILKKIETTAGSSGDPNGMAEVNLMDIDADGNTDWVYGGDMHGYVWKFDVSSSNPSSWSVAYSGAPLFQAKDNSGNRQMITGGVLSAMDPKTGKVWLFFGTGRYLNVDDPTNASVQTWYGIIDGTPIGGRSELGLRAITNVGDQRVVSEISTMESGKKGWYMDLPDTRERVVDMPAIVGSELMMNTVIPDTNVCNPSGSGYIMAISPFTGSRLKKLFFDINDDDKFTTADMVTVAGSPTVVSGVKVTSLNSVATLAKVNDIIKSYNNCEGACVEERTIDPTRNSGMQSWRVLNN